MKTSLSRVKVLLAPTAVGAYGRVAVVFDPQSAPRGLAGVTGSLPAEPAPSPLNRCLRRGPMWP